jgi:hypothetical protein
VRRMADQRGGRQQRCLPPAQPLPIPIPVRQTGTQRFGERGSSRAASADFFRHPSERTAAPRAPCRSHTCVHSCVRVCSFPVVVVVCRVSPRFPAWLLPVFEPTATVETRGAATATADTSARGVGGRQEEQGNTLRGLAPSLPPSSFLSPLCSRCQPKRTNGQRQRERQTAHDSRGRDEGDNTRGGSTEEQGDGRAASRHGLALEAPLCTRARPLKPSPLLRSHARTTEQQAIC